MPIVRLRYVLIFIGLLVFCLIWTAPAWLMTRLITSASNGSLEIENAEGSFWTGHAKALNYINNKKVIQRFENLSWKIMPSHLLKGDIAFRIIITDHQLTADTILSAGFSGQSISDLRANLPADLMGNFIRDIKALSPRGNLEVKIPLLTFEPVQLKQSANIQWKNAGLGISRVSPLGDYSIDLASQKESIAFYINTIKGPLNVTGKGNYSQKTGGTFNGNASVNDEAKTQLASLLQLMGPSQNNGNVNISFTFPTLKK